MFSKFKNNKMLIISAILAFNLTINLNAQQIKTPAASPTAEFKQTVGLTDISIVYSRPGVKGREIFGDLVPYGKLWRTGANMATKITFSEDVKIEGETLAAGSYALFSVPGEDEWTLIFNTNVNQSGTGSYDESLDALRVKVKAGQLGGEGVESLLININGIRNDYADMVLIWANTIVSAKIEVNTDEQVMANIKAVMDPASEAGKYWAAANYYFESDKDLDQAIEWVNKSIALGNNRFWVVHLKAKMLQKKGNCKEAIAVAEESKKMAQDAGSDDYVALNDKLIASCK